MRKKFFKCVVLGLVLFGMNGHAAPAVFEGLDPLLWQMEPQAILSHTIEMRRAMLGRAKAADVAVAEIVGENKDEVGKLALIWRGGG